MRQPSAELVEQLCRDAMQRDDWREAERLGAQLDELCAPKQPTMLAAARWYAKQGLHVFPLQAGQKIPHARSRGCLDATTDVEQIERWWHARPDSNVGIATGHLLDVIDIDGRAGHQQLARRSGKRKHVETSFDDVLECPSCGRQWVASFYASTLCTCSAVRGRSLRAPQLSMRERIRSDSIGSVSTPREGGTHFYVAASGIGNGAALATGVDYRGRGGYVLAPPSRTAQGLYVWTRALDVAALTQISARAASRNDEGRIE